MEVLAARPPVAAVCGSGVEDVVVGGFSGLLSDSSVDALAACPHRLASDSELRAQLAKGARRTSQRFDIQRTSARLLTHCHRLVDERALKTKRSSQVRLNA